MPCKLNFVLIGLPGVGKTTITKEYLESIKNNLSARDAYFPEYQIISTDEVIKEIIVTQNHPALIDFTEHCVNFHSQHPDKYNKKFEGLCFFIDKTPRRIVQDMFSEYGEHYWRDLEAICIGYIFRQYNGQCIIFDLGGKAFLHPFVREKINEMGLKSVFLSASHEQILARLSSGDAWQKRSNYAAEAVKWPQLSYRHRHERVSTLIEDSDIAVDTTDKSVQQVAKEVLYAMRASEIADEDREDRLHTCQHKHSNSNL